MTREEEIERAAEAFDIKIISNPWTLFQKGAEWADAHPKQIEISLEDIEELAKEVIPEDWVEQQERLWDMIRRNQRAQFITKACEWLKIYAHVFVSETTGDLNEDDLINAFRKAMIGE